MKKGALLFILFFVSNFVFSASIIGKVEKIDVHGNSWGNYNPNDLGVLSLYIEGMPKSCNDPNGNNRVVITSDHPLFNSVLSIALAAKMSGRNLYVQYLDTCNTRAGAWDFGYVSLRE